MGAAIKLYVDWFGKRLLTSPRNTSPATMPVVFQGDILPMEIYVLEPDPEGGPNSYLYPAIGDMTMKLAVGAAPIGTTATPTPFVTQFTWSKNTTTKKFSANVAFNTAELNTWLGAEASKVAYAELEMTEGAAIATIYQGSMTVKAQLIETGTTVVAAGLTPMSREEALQLFVKFSGNAAGSTITLPSSDGAHETVLGTDTDGAFTTEHQVPF